MRIADQVAACGDENPLVPLALGVASALEAAKRALDDDRPDGAAEEGPAAPLDGEDPVVLAALGVLALRRSVGRWLAVLCSQPTRDEATPGHRSSNAPALRAGRGLLR
jgi:hypothetical protein